MNRLAQIILSLLSLILTFQAHAIESPYVFIKNYTPDEYKAGYQNKGIALTPNGMLYLANNAGLLGFDGNNWNLYPLPGKEEITNITYYKDSIYTKCDTMMGRWGKDELGEMNYEPLEAAVPDMYFEKKVKSFLFTLPEEIAEGTVSAVNASSQYYFIGTLTKGLYILDHNGTILRHLSQDDQLPDDCIRFISVQDETQIWASTDNGISQITLNHPLVLLGKREQIGKLEHATLRDETLYIKTNYGYFKRTLHPRDQFVEIPDSEGERYIPNNIPTTEPALQDIFKDAETLKLLQMTDHIYPVSEDMYWLTRENEAALYQNEDGVGFLKCRMLFGNYDLRLISLGNKIVPLNMDYALASTTLGCILIKVRDLIGGGLAKGSPPMVRNISYIDGKKTVLLPIQSEKIVLPHDFHNLSINVCSSIFTPNPQISYQIEEVSGSWSPWQSEGKISFLQLPEGEYTLKIRKYITRGPYPEMSLKIKITPPWYNTVWAYLGYLIIIWGIVGYQIDLTRQKYHQEVALKEEAKQQAEREKRLVDRNKELEATVVSKDSELSTISIYLLKRNETLQEIADELDRQKNELGDRYPNKLYNRLKTLMEQSLNNQEDWDQFEQYFNNVNNHFVDRLRKQYPDLTSGDIRTCCLLRINLLTKEIASMMHTSIRAVELRRYRLRKRLGLEGDTNLVDFLLDF